MAVLLPTRPVLWSAQMNRVLEREGEGASLEGAFVRLALSLMGTDGRGTVKDS